MLRRLFFHLWLAAHILLLIGEQYVLAQTPRPNPGESRAASPRAPGGQADDETPTDGDAKTRRSVEDVGGDADAPAFFLFDDKGELILTPNVRYEDIMEFFRWKRGYAKVDNAPPAYAIQSIEVNGEVENDVVKMTIAVRVLITAKKKQPISVALKMNNLVRPQVRYTGPGKHFLTYQDTGFVSWLSGEPNSAHTITLQALAHRRKNTDGGALTLQLPMGATQIHLTVPTQQAHATLNGQTRGVTTSPAGTSTKIDIESNGGDQEIDWRRESTATSTPSLLMARSSLTVEVENPRLIRVHAELDVRTTSGELDSFLVRLPPNMKWITRNNTVAYRVTPSRTERIGDDDVQIVRVRLDKPARQTPRIRLSAERTRLDEDATKEFEAWGFDVLDAVQSGDVQLAASDNWMVLPTGARAMTRVRNDSPPNRVKPTVAKFEVMDQPCSLKVKVQAKQTRLTVAPTYVIDVTPRQVVLELRMKCGFTGGRAPDFDVDLSGWTLSEVTPDNLSVADGASAVRDGVLTIPLSQLNDPPMGEVEVVVKAKLDIDDEATRTFAAILPRAEPSEFAAGAVLLRQAALLIVASANNVELAPKAELMPFLVEQSLEESIVPATLTGRQQAPFGFRAVNADDELSFLCDFNVHPQSISADIEGLAEVDQRQLRVEQRLIMQVSYEELNRLRLSAPDEVVASDRFTVLFDNQVLPVSVSRAEEGRQWVDIDLPAAQLGRVELLIRYQLPLPELRTDVSHQVAAAMLLPPREFLQIGTQSLRLSAPEDIQLEGPQDDQNWRAAGPSIRVNDRIEQTYRSTRPLDRFDFGVRTSAPISGESILVGRAWLQTWLTQSQRFERAAFRLTTSNERLQIQIPDGAEIDSEKLIVAVDGMRVTDLTIDPQGQIDLQLPSSTQAERVLELWYQFAGRGPAGSLTAEPPRLTGVNRVESFLWQLVTPPKEHLLAGPNNMTPELTWERSGLIWGRGSALSQRELEQFVGASNRRVSPATSTNQYLFSNFGGVGEFRAYTVRRGFLVTCVAGVVFALGMLWLHLPTDWRPVFFLTATIALISLSAVFPEPATAVAQVAFLGVALCLIGALIRWAVWRGRQPRTMIHGASLTEAPTVTRKGGGSSLLLNSTSPPATAAQSAAESGV